MPITDEGLEDMTTDEITPFLASSRAKWLTGAQFRVDGGILPTV